MLLAPTVSLSSPRAMIARDFFSMFGFVFSTYVFGMGMFLVGGIREFAQTSLVTAVFLSLFALAYSLPTYLLPLCARYFHNRGEKFYLVLAVLSGAAAAYPNMGNMGPGEVFAQYSAFQPLVRVLGTSSLAALYHFVSIGATQAALKAKWRRAIGLVASFLALAAGAFAFDSTFNPKVPMQANLRLGLVQTMNLIGSIEKGEIQVKSSEKMAGDLFADLGARLNSQPVDVLIMPEGGLNVEFPQSWDSTLNERLASGSYFGLDSFLTQHQTYLIAEFSGQRWSSDGVPLNSYLPAAWLYSKYQAHLIDLSYKYHLVPFIEYVPGGASFEAWRKLFPWAWALKSDMAAKSFILNGFRFRTLICYDNLFSEAYFSARKDGAQFLVSMTNNASLHEGGHYQYAIARARTVESGMPMVYVGNYGDTGVMGGVRTAANQFAFVRAEAKDLVGFNTFYAEHLADLFEPIFAVAGTISTLGFWLGLIIVGIVWIRARRIQFKAFCLSYVLPVGAVILAYYFITANIIQYIYVPTSSMYPSIEPGSKIWLCRYRRDYQRGDTLSASLGNAGHQVLKRLILLPGERLLKGGQIISPDGSTHQISYRRDHDQCFESIDKLEWAIACEDVHSLTSFESPKMGGDEYFIMGDNRQNSADSRVMGPVKRDKIKGARCAF